MNADKLIKIQQRIKVLEEQKSRAEITLDMNKKELKEQFEVETIEEAEEMVTQISKTLQTLEDKYTNLIADMENQLDGKHAF
jgi:hypothetical protein